MRLLLFPGAALLAAVLLVFTAGPALGQEQARFVGSEACQGCHPDEYENFTKYAKKATSAESVQLMASDLTQSELEDCYGCHTTGYGQPGGFVSYEETPELGDAGCEVCHGPGSLHVEYGGDPAEIKGKLTLDDCNGCHNQDRVKSFDFKPLLYGGAH